MRVESLMSGKVVTIRASESCRQALTRMHRARVRHLPVLGPAGSLVGIVTDRDLRHQLFRPNVYERLGTLPADTLLEEVPVAEVMSTPVVTATPKDDLAAAAGRMLAQKLGCLPVVDDGQVVGIVTETDLLREICRAADVSPEVVEIVVSYP